MSKKPLIQAKNTIVDDRGLAFTVYILYFLGYVTGITSIIGVMIAYFQDRSANSELVSHFTFQIRTFWIGFVYLVVGAILLEPIQELVESSESVVIHCWVLIREGAPDVDT